MCCDPSLGKNLEGWARLKGRKDKDDTAVAGPPEGTASETLEWQKRTDFGLTNPRSPRFGLDDDDDGRPMGAAMQQIYRPDDLLVSPENRRPHRRGVTAAEQGKPSNLLDPETAVEGVRWVGGGGVRNPAIQQKNRVQSLFYNCEENCFPRLIPRSAPQTK